MTILQEYTLDEVSAAVGVAAAAIALWRYLRGRSKKEQIAQIGISFRDIVSKLSSDDEIERLAAAILIRRFFRPSSEYGVGFRELPYAEESVDVISALLRKTEEGEFQKALADGLRYAPSLKGCDFQSVNLSHAYLGDRGDGRTVDISEADFFKAKLQGTSLRGAAAIRTVFYEAFLKQTVFDNADLQNADFRRANLENASFRNANLAGCRFDGASLVGAVFTGAIDSPVDGDNSEHPIRASEV